MSKRDTEKLVKEIWSQRVKDPGGVCVEVCQCRGTFPIAGKWRAARQDKRLSLSSKRPPTSQVPA